MQKRPYRACLEGGGYRVDEAGTLKAALNALAARHYDLVTLDTVMGTENSLEHVQAIKANRDIRIIVVTGKGDVIDRVVGLKLGVDDYLPKPFHIRELLARARALLRRKPDIEPQNEDAPSSHLIDFENWQLDTQSRELFHKERGSVEITTTEFNLLVAFLQNQLRVLSRDQLFDMTSGGDRSPFDRTIDNQVARLRRKIEADPKNPKLIKTVRGVGYVFSLPS